MNEILDGLNTEQKKAVMHQKGPLLILAGAGSGKTRVLTHRIAYLIEAYNVSPWNILALTFTNKAAGEMRERVDAIVEYGAENIWVSTFHSTCVRILRRYIEPLGYTRSFTIYDSDDQKSLMKDVCKYLNIDTKQYKERTILNHISSAKDILLSPEQYADSVRGDYTKEVYARAYKEYQKRLQQSNALDFDDLIFKTVELFENHPDVLSYYRNRFQYILVDEYQDTNAAQFKLISLMANAPDDEGGTSRNLCVVGDDDQSIYKFRGADIRNILDFETQYPDALVIKLEQNYRSTQTILEAANHVIKHNMMRKDKALWSEKPKGTPISYTQFLNEYDEAANIAGDIAGAVEAGDANYRDFAILYRTNAQSRVFEEKLIMQNIPYKIVGAVNFYQRKEIKDMLAYLRTIDNARDDISAKRIINTPKRGIGLTTIDRINSYAALHNISFYEALLNHEYIEGLGRSSSKLTAFVSLMEDLKRKLENPTYSLKELLEEILEETGYLNQLREEDTDQARARIENLEELMNTVVTYEENAEEQPTLSGFLEEVSLVADIDSVDDNNNLVLLMTLHSAKGLEFPYVYLCGMEEGVFPGYMAITADTPDEVEEERRLCYVGITRAMDRLSLSCARSRMRNGEQQFNRPSRFIEEIPRFLLQKNVSAQNMAGFGGYGRSFPDNALFSVPSQGLENRKTESYSAAAFLEKQSTIFEKPKPVKSKNEAKASDPFAGNPLITKGFGSKVTVPSSSKAGSPSGAPSYQTGDTVRHMRFGIGTVTALKQTSSDYEVTVDFEQAGTRKMLASFAKLKKL